MDISREKLEKVIELYEQNLEQTLKIKTEGKTIGKDEIEIAAEIFNNSNEYILINFLNSFSQLEKDEVFAIFKFGRDYDLPSIKNFEFYKRHTKNTSKEDILYITAKPLSKYLRNGLMKLDIIQRNN